MKKIPKQTGFSLLEIAIVMLIIGIIMGGVIGVVSSQKDLQQYKTTKQAMREIKEALYGFAMANGRLPCPADPTSSAGTEDCSAGNSGVVPWVTLTTQETDGWGRRFTYYVTSGFSDSDSTTPSCSEEATSGYIPVCATGGITVNESASAGADPVASEVPVVIVSHGPNGHGAYPSSGSQIAVPIALFDEKENADGNANFVTHEVIVDGEEFDDIVDWLSTPILMNRMLAAGKLP